MRSKMSKCWSSWFARASVVLRASLAKGWKKVKRYDKCFLCLGTWHNVFVFFELINCFGQIFPIFRLYNSHSLNKCYVFSMWAHKVHSPPPPSIPLFASTKLTFWDDHICLFIIKKAVSFVLRVFQGTWYSGNPSQTPQGEGRDNPPLY